MQSRRYLLLGTLFIALLIGAMSVVALKPLIPALANILMLLVGLFTMAALTAFHRLLESTDRKPLVQITFNEHIATSQIETAAKRADVNVIDAELMDIRQDPSEVRPEDLLGQDNSFALAKLRIDIERELRRLATLGGLASTTSRLDIRRLAQELQKRQLLDPSLLAVLDDILPVANQAIHGMEVSTETTAVILRLGRQLVGLLHVVSERLSHQQVPH